MIPRLKPTLGLAELRAIANLPRRSGVAEFEEAFAREMRQRHAVAFPYGRTGLLMLLRALGVRGQEVICPAYTCVVVPHAVVVSGNEPVFVDSRADDYNMDLDAVRQAVNERTGAIIATSIFGYPVNVDQINQLRTDFPHVPVIQDCAHSFAAEWNGQLVNRAGEAAVFGLNVSKLITSVFGGMVTTDRDDLAADLRAIRNRELKPASASKELRRLLYLLAVYPAFSSPVYGMVNRLERLGVLNRFVRYYDESLIAMPEDYLDSMTSTEGWVGAAQVTRYQDLIRTRREIAAYYDRELSGIGALRLPPLVEGATYSHYVPRTQEREALLAAALREGVQLGRLIEYSIPEMPAYRDRPGSRNRDFPHARAFSRTTVNLPLSAGHAAAERVVDVLRQTLS